MRFSKFTSPANASVISGDDDGELLGLGGLVCGGDEDDSVGDAVLQAVGASTAADNPVSSTRLEITPPA